MSTMVSVHATIDTGTGAHYDVDNVGGYSVHAIPMFDQALSAYGFDFDALDGADAGPVADILADVARDIRLRPVECMSLLPDGTWATVRGAADWLFSVSEMLSMHPACTVSVRRQVSRDEDIHC